MASRYHRGRPLGATVHITPIAVHGQAPSGVFQAPSHSCPAGYHWEDDPAPIIRGMSACVPNPSSPHLAIRPPTLVLGPPASSSSAPSTDRASAPATECPEPWPWWWLLVALAGGAVAGHLVAKSEKTNKAVKKNGARLLENVGSRIVRNATPAALAPLLR